jgi:hypothetical protein
VAVASLRVGVWGGATALHDGLEEQLAKQLAQVRSERDELAVVERGLERVSEQFADGRALASPEPGQVGGRTVMLIPHRTPDVEETVLPLDYQRILAVMRHASCVRPPDRSTGTLTTAQPQDQTLMKQTPQSNPSRWRVYVNDRGSPKISARAPCRKPRSCAERLWHRGLMPVRALVPECSPKVFVIDGFQIL